MPCGRGREGLAEGSKFHLRLEGGEELTCRRTGGGEPKSLDPVLEARHQGWSKEET